MNIHPIQEKILHSLMMHYEPLRYRDLRVSEIPNDQFNYHLQTLRKKGLISKYDTTYRLTMKGKRVVEEDLALGAIRPKADKFKLYSHAVIVDNSGDKIISRKRMRQPFYGDRGIHGISVNRGETTIDAIHRHYMHCLGIKIQNAQLYGIIRKIRILKNEVFSDMLHYIYVCNSIKGEPDFNKEFAKGWSWRSLKNAITDEQKTKTPIRGLVKILEMVKEDSLTNEVFIKDEEIYHMETL